MTTPPATGRTELTDVLRAIDGTLLGGPRDYRLPDFLAAVDWSAGSAPAPTVADLLGRLELWDSEYQEGDLEWDEFVARLVPLIDDDRDRPDGSAPAS